MKKIILTSLCAVFAFAVLSCSKNQSKSSSSKVSDTLRMNVSSEPDSFFPWKSAAADTEAIFDNIYEGLLRFDENGSLYPCLAESWTLSDDKLTYTFKLRKGVKFHDGTEFTSRDCFYTYENLAGLNGKKQQSLDMSGVEKIEAPDDYTFIITLKKPSGSFISLTILPVLLHDYDDNENHPVGTGPYKFTEYQIHQIVRLTKNDDYWNPEKGGTIRNIEIYIMTDENAVLSAMQSKQLDIAQMVSAANLKAFSKTFTTFSCPQNMAQVMGLNEKYAPLADLNVRKAITCAINKKEIIDGVFEDTGIEIYSNFSPILKQYYNDQLSDILPYDVEKAKEYLKNSSFPDGFDLTITVPANYQPHVDTAQLIADQLSKINIRCTIEPVEWATWLDKVYTRFEYQSTVIGFSGKYDPAEVLRRYYSTYKRNFTCFYNSEFDSTFDAAVAETDIEKRTALFKECQKILTENAPAVFICDPGLGVMTQKNVAGYTAYPAPFYDFTKIYFTK